MSNRENILEAKRRLPLPELMAQLGHADAAKHKARCPFHEDSTASFSIFKKDNGEQQWNCFAGCGKGDEIDFLAKKKGLANGAAVGEFLKLAGITTSESFDWRKCVADFTEAEAQKLAEWRGLSIAFVRWLRQQGAVGIFENKLALANHGARGQVVSAHVRLGSGKWIFKPKGERTAPLIFGDTKAAGYVLAFESQWDAFAVMDKLDWHTANGLPDSAVLITRGAANGKLIRGQVSPDTVCFAFKQNDAPTPKKPIPAGDTWLTELAAVAGCRVLNVATPAPHKDANDWTKAGATKTEIEAAIVGAKPIQPLAAQLETGSESQSDTCLDTADFAAVTAWIRGETLRTLADKESSPTVKNSNVAKLVVDALAQIGRFYFHADLRDFASALFFNAHSKRLERIRSDGFTAWLSNWLVINRASGLFKYISSEVETAALSSAHTTGILPEAYFAARPSALYLSNGDGQAVKVTADAVQLVDNGADGVLFAAGRTLQPWRLVTPRDAFETCAIFRNAHSSATHGRTLLQLWLFSFATMPRSKPPLGAIGEIGCGKTRTLKGIAELYGLPFRAAKVEEQLEPNFWPNVNEGGLFILDNADTRVKWLADAVAAAATDGCSQRRKLYTNSETVTLRANAWLAITSANPTFGNDAGLADRLLLVKMERRGEETSDTALTDEILANRDAGLSHIAATLRLALADTAPVPSGLNKRHPDFAAFAVRIGRALGREPEAVAALQQAEADKSAFCLENDTIGAALIGYLRTAQSFHGTAADLVPKLVEQDGDLAERLSAKRLAKRLGAVWPHLQSALATAKRETDRKGFLVFSFKNAESADIADIEMGFSQNS